MTTTPDADALEAGRLLFAGPVTFERGVVKMDGLPAADRPEVAFAGRSNVGKSSLVNALTGRKALARASGEPGRTRELNFFLLGDRMRFVDMPGYGYAKAPKTEIERWTKLVRDYLRGRPGLARVFLLVDARHGIKANDETVMDMLDESAVVYQVVLTKADKLPAKALDAIVAETVAALLKRPAAHPVVLPVSAFEGGGIPELRAAVAALAVA
ncbi:MAG: YihA family ribosome biogenesis GTP-binding protein [Hyphomonadaceae bacterium]|nr:MAG: GTP-binding protein [Caulobacteraceae bacterium]MBT9445345.1 YihA family ribosome biogenesis GTP-binding protein [Hyphomonadaceae bacterium]TPW05928.1 MAG: GTP-binding protein [Alphaproteobacteria bacterium]